MSGLITPATAIEPLDEPIQSFPFVDADGRLTNEGHQLLLQYRNFINGIARVIPCDADISNPVNSIITLSPLAGGPTIAGYRDFDIYVAKPTGTFAGTMRAQVALSTGPLAMLNVFKNGTTFAVAGDIVSASVYMFIFADHLDSGAGGFFLK